MAPFGPGCVNWLLPPRVFLDALQLPFSSPSHFHPPDLPRRLPQPVVPLNPAPPLPDDEDLVPLQYQLRALFREKCNLPRLLVLSTCHGRNARM